MGSEGHESAAAPSRAERILDAFPDTVVRCSRDGVVLDVLAARPPSGSIRFDRATVVGARLEQLSPPGTDTAARVREAIARAADTGEITACTWQYVEPKTEARSWWHGRFARVGRDEVVIVARDVTDTHSRRDADRLTAELSRALIVAPAESPDAAVTDALRRIAGFVDGWGAVVVIPNDAFPSGFERIYEWAPTGVPPFAPDGGAGDSWLENLSRALAEPTLLEIDRLPARAPMLQWLAETVGLVALGLIPVPCERDRPGLLAVGFLELPDRVARARFLALGGIGHLLWSLRERHDTEAERQRSEVRLRSLVENCRESIIVIGRNLAVRYVNPLARRLAGVPVDPGPDASPDAEQAVDPMRHVYPDDRPTLIQAFTAALEHPGVPIPVSYRSNARDGERHDMVGTFTNLLDTAEVDGVVLNIHEVTEERRAREALERAATHDSLTGLANRDALTRVLQQRLAAGDGILGVVFLDLDHFKRVNDSLGHTAGDAVLRVVAERLRGAVDQSTLVARFAGDEFVLAATARSADDLVRLAERVRGLIPTPIVVDHAQVRLTGSVGLAVANDGSDAEALLRDADTALYTAKRLGRNRHVVFDSTLRNQVLARVGLETELQAALERDQLEVHFQPIVELASRGVIGVEALLRWHRPGFGLVAPDQFIEIAEELGSIHAIDGWMLAHALEAAAPWTIPVSINLSARELDHPDLEEVVTTALQRVGFPPGRLCLEITETSYAEASQPAVDLLQRLRATGVSVAIDDYGSGYSSISRVREYPIDVIKIDRSLVTNLPDSARDRVIVRSIVDLAHALGVRLLAEGVESEAHHRTLVDLGCDDGQGFLYGAARPVEDIEALLFERIDVRAAPAVGR